MIIASGVDTRVWSWNDLELTMKEYFFPQDLTAIPTSYVSMQSF